MQQLQPAKHLETQQGSVPETMFSCNINWRMLVQRTQDSWLYLTRNMVNGRPHRNEVTLMSVAQKRGDAHECGDCGMIIPKSLNNSEEIGAPRGKLCNGHHIWQVMSP
jgi:hypothetical protein